MNRRTSLYYVFDDGARAENTWVLVEEGDEKAMRPDGIILALTVRHTEIPHLLLNGVWMAGATYLMKAAAC